MMLPIFEARTEIDIVILRSFLLTSFNDFNHKPTTVERHLFEQQQQQTKAYQVNSLVLIFYLILILIFYLIIIFIFKRQVSEITYAHRIAQCYLVSSLRSKVLFAGTKISTLIQTYYFLNRTQLGDSNIIFGLF